MESLHSVYLVEICLLDFNDLVKFSDYEGKNSDLNLSDPGP